MISDSTIRKALKIRNTELVLLNAYAKGKLRGTIHTCIGQELQQVIVLETLDPSKDWVFSNHRCHGHFLSFNGTTKELFAEVAGRTYGSVSGNGGSQHINKGHFFSSGIQGSFVPVAAGVASSLAIEGGDGIVVVFIGDGTLGEGILWESLNYISVNKLPMLIVCEDNGIAQSTLKSASFNGDLRLRVEGFGIKYEYTDLNSLSSFPQEMSEHVNFIRDDRAPSFLHIKTARLMAHSKGDDNRDPDYLREISDSDFLNVALCKNSELYESNLVMHDALEHELSEVLELGETAVTPMSDRSFGTNRALYKIEFPRVSLREQIYSSLKKALESHKNLVMIGEDIEYIAQGTSKPYGGAFKVTGDLSSLFPGRVKNTPISEGTIIGVGVGRALAGLPTIVEIMFSDFLSLGFDQIVQNMSKFPWMYDAKYKLPIVIRTPSGAGYGYGATHSQSIEKHFVGIPEVEVFSTNALTNYEFLLMEVIENRHPTIIFENKIDYNWRSPSNLSDDFLSYTDYCSFQVIGFDDKDVEATVITHGGMVVKSLEAMRQIREEYGFNLNLISVQKISPMEVRCFEGWVSSNALVVEEGEGSFGISAEIIAQLSELREIPHGSIRRLFGTGKVGFSVSGESEAIPSIQIIKAELLKLLRVVVL